MSGVMSPALADGVSVELRRAALTRCQAITKGARASAADEAWRGLDWQFRLMLVSFFLPHLDGSRVIHQPWAKLGETERRTLASAVRTLAKQTGQAAPRLHA
jgi:hypothetical protein